MGVRVAVCKDGQCQFLSSVSDTLTTGTVASVCCRQYPGYCSEAGKQLDKHRASIKTFVKRHLDEAPAN